MWRSINRWGRAGRRGFTLVEMLVVAALIALFSGMAIFSIQGQFEKNKQKAAVAECRHIATAVNFAQQDVGYYPKICFLQFTGPDLLDQLRTIATYDRASEVYGNPVGNVVSRIQKNWKSHYASHNPERTVQMSAPSFGGGKFFTWPADPWGNPYMLYLIHSYYEFSGGRQTPQHRLISMAGEDPNYFAGVVTHGRNRVPGVVDNPTDDGFVTAREPARLYIRIDSRNYRLKEGVELQDPNIVDMMIPNLTTPSPQGPRIREEGSDDRFYEF